MTEPTAVLAAPDGTRPGSTSRAVLLSTSSQAGAKVLHLGLNVVSTVAVSRYLSPGGYGDYVLVLTVAAIVGLVSDLGLTKIGVREIARDPGSEGEILGSVICARLALAVLGVGLTLGVMVALGVRREVVAAAAVISLLYFTEALLSVVIVFHARIEQQYEALVRVAIEALETGLVLVLIARGAGLVGLMAAPIAGAVIGVLIAGALARRRLGHLPRPGWSRAPMLVREGLPVGLTLVLAAAYLKMPSIMLIPLRGRREAGLYAVAYQPIEYLLLASAVVINVMLPLLTRALLDDRQRFLILYRRGTEALVAGAIPIAGVMVVCGPALVRMIFGAEFAGSGDPLRLLGLALVPMVVSFWQSVVLLSGGHQRITLAYDLLALVVTVGLGFVLMPAFGPAGAAMVLLVTSIVVVGCATAATWSRLGVAPDLLRLGPIVVVGVLAVGGAEALREAGTASGVAIAVALTAYAALLWALGLVPSTDMFGHDLPSREVTA